MLFNIFLIMSNKFASINVTHSLFMIINLTNFSNFPMVIFLLSFFCDSAKFPSLLLKSEN